MSPVKTPRNTVTLMLMISSIVLLIALQYLWLRSSYEKTYFDFSRESSLLLRTTVYNLRDSMFAKNIKPIDPDSLNVVRRQQLVGVEHISEDSLKGLSNIQVFIKSTDTIDSTMDVLQPLASSVHKLDRRQSFVVRMPDTLDVAILTHLYTSALKDAGMHLPFQIKHIVNREPELRMPIMDPEFSKRNEQPLHLLDDTLTTEHINLTPHHVYAAVFPDMKSNVLQEILLQILFSAFLTLTVVTAFLVTYRNLRAQQRLNELKNDFISNVTHELKTPLATVSVALEALKDFHALDDPERTDEYLKIAQSELHRLTLMTDKILKASVFETQGLSFVSEKINLNSIIQKILSSLKLVFEKNDLRVAYTPVGNDFELSGSEIHLTNVIYNLLDNALKYGNNQSNIDLQLKDSEGFLEFTIRDQGVGIAKEYQKKIFEKFFRVPTGDIHNVKGYGLGLNYVARVIEKHGGSIDVESELGKGSLFKIRLPK